MAVDAVKRKTKYAESFGNLLEPQTIDQYDPYYLDHPDLKTGKNKTVITLPGFLGTIIQPSTTQEIKKELNQHFKEAHPDLMMTLSNIRGLKEMMCNVGLAQNLELSSIAFAYVYLEKLVLKNYLTKQNRKVIAAVCLLLATKVNDSKDTDFGAFMSTLEREMEVSKKEVYANEFSVYVALEFSLFLALWEVKPHLKRVEELTALVTLD